MNLLEIILIVAGISLDIFAAMEIEGAMLAKINQKTLWTVSALVVIMQQIFFFFGYASSRQLIDYTNLITSPQKVGYWIAAIIFLVLGVRLGYKAYRRETIQESRRQISVVQYMRIIAVASIYTIAAGVACGMIGINVLMVFVTIVVGSIISTVGGIYTGYHFGVSGKTVVYAIGAVLLWIAGIEIMLRHIYMVFG